MILVLPALAAAQAVLSEVLYNEPEGRVNLEWVEIYNTGDTTIDLGHYFISAAEDTSFFAPASYIPAHSYAILARRLLAQDGSDSFEGYWGDSSGYWGDGVTENFAAFDMSLGLPNSSGDVTMGDTVSGETDWCIWDGTSGDGISIERDRVDPPSLGWHRCSSYDGSTPGAPNSSPLADNSDYRFEVEPRLISLSGGGTVFDIKYLAPGISYVTMEIFDDAGHRRKTFPQEYSPQARISWDGTGDDGARLIPGVYLVVFVAGSVRKTVPVVIAP